ncbi:hypothetical protein [Brevibacillus humidisoli]|nr:hypothetical protein [Brevibacillus humidisoli]
MSLLTLLSLSGLMIIELVRPYLNAQLPLILQESHNLASMA